MVLLPLLLAGGYYAKWEFVDHRLVTITEGSVYQSAAMPAEQLVEVMRSKGMRTVIDLRDSEPEAVLAEREALVAAGLHHVHLPMPQDPGGEHVGAFLEVMQQCDLPVLVHCEHGQGRSVLMCAVYRIEHEGWSRERAFQGTTRLPEMLQPLTWIWPQLRRFRADTYKGRFVLEYAPVNR